MECFYFESPIAVYDEIRKKTETQTTIIKQVFSQPHGLEFELWEQLVPTVLQGLDHHLANTPATEHTANPDHVPGSPSSSKMSPEISELIVRQEVVDEVEYLRGHFSGQNLLNPGNLSCKVSVLKLIISFIPEITVSQRSVFRS